MKYNLLGNTGLRVSELCLGTMTFGGAGRFAPIGKVGQEAANEILKTSLDAGINFIDTANAYSFGLSEEMTGRAIRHLGVDRDELVISTKVYRRMGPGPNNEGLTRKHIMQPAEATDGLYRPVSYTCVRSADASGGDIGCIGRPGTQRQGAVYRGQQPGFLAIDEGAGLLEI